MLTCIILESGHLQGSSSLNPFINHQCWVFFYHDPLQFGEKLVDVSVTVVRHEKNVLVFKLRLGVAPFQLRISGPGKDEAVQNDVWVIQPLFDFFDTLMEQQLLTQE